MSQRRITVLLLTLLALLAFLPGAAGCGGRSSEAAGEPGLTGYVMDIRENQFLVVDSKPQDFGATGGKTSFYNAIWFSNKPADLETGLEVKVWFDMVAESYPGHSEALHVEVVPTQTPAGANLSEAEALQKALKELDDNGAAWGVQALQYDSTRSVWVIELIDILFEGTETVEIEG